MSWGMAAASAAVAVLFDHLRQVDEDYSNDDCGDAQNDELHRAQSFRKNRIVTCHICGSVDTHTKQYAENASGCSDDAVKTTKQSISEQKD